MTFSFEPIDKAIVKFQFHHSILLIKSKINTSNSFSLRQIETDNVDKEIRTLNLKKAGTKNDIPVKVLKKYQSVIAPICKSLSIKI